jgi:hypothetical protein
VEFLKKFNSGNIPFLILNILLIIFLGFGKIYFETSYVLYIRFSQAFKNHKKKIVGLKIHLSSYIIIEFSKIKSLTLAEINLLEEKFY